MSENEIMKSLGPSMFSRIGCFIEYDDISIEQKQKIIGKWYLEILERLKTEERKHIENTNIREWFMKNSNRYNNIRILKTKLENAVFDELTDSFIIKATDNNIDYF